MDGHPNLRADRNKRPGRDDRRQPSAPVALRIERTVSSRWVLPVMQSDRSATGEECGVPISPRRFTSGQKASRIWPSYSWRDGNNCLSAATYSRLSLVNLTVSAVMVTWNRSRNR